MKRLQNGSIVVKLSQGCIQSNEEGVVDTGMSNIVADSSNQQRESIERSDECRNRRRLLFRLSCGFWKWW